MSPPALCVVSTRCTVFHLMSMSGWWFAASAAAPTALTNARAAAKSCSCDGGAQLVAHALPGDALLGQRAVDLRRGQDRLAHGCVISSGRTAASNCSAVRKPQLEGGLAQRGALLVRLLGHLGRPCRSR